MSKLIVVANKVLTPHDAPHAGGLARGLQHALKRFGGLWFGWSGNLVDTTQHRAEVTTCDGVSYATMDLTRTEYEDYYLGFANSTLWTLFHQPAGEVEFRQERFAGYCQVNAAFADALLPLIEKGDLIWVHDYHLIPLGAELRRRGIKNRIGFFLHTPFVPPSVLQILPCYGRLIEDLCRYDLVGFQTDKDLQAFNEHLALRHSERSSAVTSRPQRSTHAAVFPIGIDPEEITQLAEAADAAAHCKLPLPPTADSQLVIGVDRLDHSKGLPNRLDAYEQLLRRYPEHRRKVSLLQIAPLSRSEIDSYRSLCQQLEAKVGHINGTYAELDWNPIHYVNKAYPPETLGGLYRRSRVALVTSLRDGMNLVAKEYVASQNPANPGVLVLSHFAGAARELDSALLVNPWDVDQMSDALHRALSMPLGERRARWVEAMAAVRRNTATSWCENFVDALRNPVLDKSVERIRRVEPRVIPRIDPRRYNDSSRVH